MTSQGKSLTQTRLPAAIERRIFFLRGQKIMLSFDLASVETTSREQLSGLASIFAGIGSKQRALQLLDEAFESAKAIADDFRKSAALEDIVKRYALLGELERASDAASLMRKGPFKDNAMIAIAKKYAEAGEYERALAINDSLETTNFKPDILIMVAKEYLTKGNKQKATELLYQALALSKNVTASNLQQFARIDIVLLLAKAGKFDVALDIAKKASGQSYKLKLMTGIAIIFSQAGEQRKAEKLLARALALTDFSSGTYFQASDIVEVANAYRAIGNRERAMVLLSKAVNVLDAIQEETNKDLIFEDVAESYSLLGDDNKALNIAERIKPETNGQFLTLLWIAYKFAHAEDVLQFKDKLVGELMQP